MLGAQSEVLYRKFESLLESRDRRSHTEKIVHLNEFVNVATSVESRSRHALHGYQACSLYV